jgi:hypothetical protein
MPVTANKPAPYTSPSAVLEVIDRYRNRGLQKPINRDVMGRAGIADGLISRTLQALQILDLIDDKGMPTQTFEALRLASEAEYKKRLEDWLKSAYADVFAFVDPIKDDETRIRDAFRSYHPVAQQPRMVALFQGLCGAAGLIPDRADKAMPSPRPAARQTMPPSAQKRVAAAHQPPVRTAARHSSGDLPAPLAGLLASLPPDGEGWTKDARDKFMATFETVLDFCIPIVKSTREKEGGDQKTAA